MKEELSVQQARIEQIKDTEETKCPELGVDVDLYSMFANGDLALGLYEKEVPWINLLAMSLYDIS